ncbi:DUF1080 domain-containing protein [Mucilaginibacter sp.]|uniref:3-keto-disaccharide hydrolase n=1 Tax=Mucilaginibacter sp. TaxID=1882438 RepID=UPI0026319159|nr:DUF1080 domain-containing protein [Mucilaginibacter sp.]MDB5029618.1 hypothetical protein [Mucilaginibacter sp.]
MKLKPILIFSVFLLLSTSVFSQDLTNKWTSLLTKDGRNFDVFIGIPHKSLTSLPGWDKGDGMNTGTPLGLNNDPLHVFSIEMVDGQPVLHISGEIFGGYSTKKEYGNYHLKAEFKWGEKKYEPKLGIKRDNGILYHGKEPHGQFWHVWLRSPEFQVQEGDMGDLFSLAGVGSDVHARLKDSTNKKLGWIYDPAAPSQYFASWGIPGAPVPPSNLSHLKGDFEKPNGEWNVIELYCFGDKAVHVVNGHVVMVVEHLRTVPKDGSPATPLTNGHIQFQSEGAEAYYRNIQITKLDKMPDFK